MSCCPPAPPSAEIGAAFTEANGPESDIRKGESVECYMARGGNTSGLHDDATSNVDNKIENSSIPITRSTSAASINVQFRLTSGSSRTATTWTMTNDGGEALASLGFAITVGGLFAGTVGAGGLGKTFKVQVTAADGTGDIDTRGFTFAPSVGDESTDLKLISPLPGGIVNSKFGPRLHPVTNVMKPHTGIDMKMADRSVKDVVAAADGEVILAGGNPSTGYGIRVHVRHTTASGKHLCTTTYNHLNKVYVNAGDKVMAGQKLGLEGTTGTSTGNHLHFECKLPDGKFIDPEPLINGSLTVARATTGSGDAAPGSTETVNSSASLSASEVDARQASCAAFGPSYPPAEPPETTTPTPVAPPTDPFEAAWYFTMTYEVGPHWQTAPQYSPGDSEVDGGLHETKPQARKTGYVNPPNYPGGETKFGIAQKPNPSVKVDTMDYASAKNKGFNNYWQSAPISCPTKGKLVAVMMFDINYLHGPGNGRKIYQNAGINSLTADSVGKQQSDAQLLHQAQIAFINSIPRPEFTKGWTSRANALYAYVGTL